MELTNLFPSLSSSEEAKGLLSKDSSSTETSFGLPASFSIFFFFFCSPFCPNAFFFFRYAANWNRKHKYSLKFVRMLILLRKVWYNCLNLSIETVLNNYYSVLRLHRYNNLLFLLFCQLINTQNNTRISNNILKHPASISFVRLVQTSGQLHSTQSYLDNW